jgi:hypothetical protein
MNLIELKAALVIYDTASNISGSGWNFPAIFGPVATYTSAGEKLNNMGYEYETANKFRTAFVPLNCIQNTSIAECLGSSQGTPLRNPTDVYLKIFAVFRRNNATATTQDVIFASTYKTNISRSAADPGNLQFQMSAAGVTGPDGTTIGPCEYPNVYTFTTISNLFPSPIQGIAGIQNPVYPSICSGPTPAAQTSTEISRFCTDRALYDPIATQSSLPSNFTLDPINEEHKSLSLKISPNPINSQAIVSFKLPASGVAKLSIVDQYGKTVKVLLNQYLRLGSQNFAFYPNLPNGIYYCCLETTKIRVTSKFIVLK